MDNNMNIKYNYKNDNYYRLYNYNKLLKEYQNIYGYWFNWYYILF